MSLLPHERTVIIKDTIPNMFLGVAINERYGIRPVFFTEKNKRYFQVQTFFQILLHDTEEVKFEFRTAINFGIVPAIDASFFYELINEFISTAIDGFNWHLKTHTADMIIGKSYFPKPSFENNKEAIRKAWLLAQFNTGTQLN